MVFLRFLLPPVRRTAWQSPARTPLTRRLASSTPQQPVQAAVKKDTSLSGRIKHLSQEYGRAAIVVYLGISLIDYAVALGLVHQLGAKRIRTAEKACLDAIEHYTGWHRHSDNHDGVGGEGSGNATAAAAGEKDEEVSIWTEAAIAYGIHKALFIFIRVPITAAITPPLVKALQRRGYKVGKSARDAAAVGKP